MTARTNKLFGRISLSLGLLLGLGGLPAKSHGALQNPPSIIQSFDVASSTPREVEPTTAQAVQRDYVHAWRQLESALGENRPELLGEDFVGSARQQWANAVAAQKQSGLSRRITDRGHRVQIRFYSPDGSALQAIDTADFEIEYRDGSRVLSSERLTIRYIVLLTPAENSWKVRVLQELAPT